MPIEKTNPITGHELTLMPPTTQQPKPFGWIRLLNGGSDAGYIYLESPLVAADPHLGGTGNTYIVTAMPFEMMDALLSTLRNERNLQIRYFDPQSGGTAPSVFIEAVGPTIEGAKGPLLVPTEVKTDLKRILKLERT
jgi:hypothetical protein